MSLTYVPDKRFHCVYCKNSDTCSKVKEFKEYLGAVRDNLAKMSEIMEDCKDFGTLPGSYEAMGYDKSGCPY